MTECTFCPEEHATAELGVYDPIVGDRIPIPICDGCVESYDDIQEKYKQKSDWHK